MPKPEEITIFAVPDYDGQFTLFAGKQEIIPVMRFPTRKACLDAARREWPNGRNVRNGWRIPVDQLPHRAPAAPLEIHDVWY